MTTLSDHLFTALERLNRDDLPIDDIQKEVERANAVSKVGETIIRGMEFQLKAEIAKQEYLTDLAVPVHRLGNPKIKGNQNAR